MNDIKKPAPKNAGTDDSDPGVGFPKPPTRSVGVALLIMTAILVFLLTDTLSPNPVLAVLLPGLTAEVDGLSLKNLLVMMFAAGVGSMITTILGFLEHAASAGDFKKQFVPWYFARPLIGMLLGLVAYLLIIGELIVVLGGISSEELSLYGLAGIAALFGLFSKRAVEKLREVFQTLFSSAADQSTEAVASLMKKLPDDLASQVLPYTSLGAESDADHADPGSNLDAPFSDEE